MTRAYLPLYPPQTPQSQLSELCNFPPKALMFSYHYTFACTIFYLWRICMDSPIPQKIPVTSSLGYKIKAQLRRSPL